MSDFEAFASSISSSHPAKHFVGVVSVKVDLTEFKSIPDVAARRRAINEACTGAKHPCLTWFSLRSRGVKIIDKLEGSSRVIVKTSRACWEDFIKACRSDRRLSETVTGITPNTPVASLPDAAPAQTL